MWLGANVTSSELSEEANAQVCMEHQAAVCEALSGSHLRGGVGEETVNSVLSVVPASEGDLSEEPLLPNLSYITPAITLSRAQISLRLMVYV